MVSEKLFQSSPPFPDDVPVAQLSIISLARLSSGDEHEVQAMFKACQNLGFFLLDLKGDLVGEEMIVELEQIFGVIRDLMHVPPEDIVRYHANPPKSFWGYKREGFMKTETGQQDRCTFFSILQDHLLENRPAVEMPKPAQDARSLVKSYLQHGQHVVSQVLTGLESCLMLPSGTLRDLQSPDDQSGTMLRMIRCAPSLKPEDMRTGFLPHTDGGTVTLLANVLGGLQVLKPDASPDSQDEGAWQWVRPQPGCLIVNMGDAMVEWTGGVLRSNIHRVSYAPAEQRLVERFSLAMLVRPCNDARMQRVVGGLIPTLEDDERDGISVGGVGIAGLSAVEWETKKAMMLKTGKDFAQSRGGREMRQVVATG